MNRREKKRKHLLPPHKVTTASKVLVILGKVKGKCMVPRMDKNRAPTQDFKAGQ